jgi:hypothetical protein
MQKDRDAFFCEGVSPKIVRGTGRIFGLSSGPLSFSPIQPRDRQRVCLGA